MTDQDKKKIAARLMSRVNRATVNFWSVADTRGIKHDDWCVFYGRVMKLGQKLKALEIDYSPRSRKLPVEFRELFR